MNANNFDESFNENDEFLCNFDVSSHCAKYEVTPNNKLAFDGNQKDRSGSIFQKSDLKSILQSNANSTIQSFASEDFYGLPLIVKNLLYLHHNITSLYEWQQECLKLDAVNSGGNLIYSLPTSGGKTLVAELLIFRQLLCSKKDVLFILPFVAIVREKVQTLSLFATDLGFIVEEYASSKGQIPPRKRRKKNVLYIATIEKANSIINSLIELQRLESIGLIVVDELHMLGEGGNRGATLEILLTKVLHVHPKAQIIGMSATLNNIDEIKTFLNASFYSSNFRPVKLEEYLKIEDSIYRVNTEEGLKLEDEQIFKFSRILSYQQSSQSKNSDPDKIVALVLEVVPNHSCLIFCSTRKNCENVALLLCKEIPQSFKEINKQRRNTLLSTLLNEGSGHICSVLQKTIPYGIAYHHSGLTMDERKLIEEAYVDGILYLLACTSTLSAGVNLPAKRVIFRKPYVGDRFISLSQYKQMSGRAGRAGLDSSGESILITQPVDKQKVISLFHDEYDICLSSLLKEDMKGIRRLLLSTIGLQITPTLDSVYSFFNKSLCFIQNKNSHINLNIVVQESLENLFNLSLIETASGNLQVTPLGKGVFKGSIDIDIAKRLYADLLGAQEKLSLISYLHIIYLITPYDLANSIQPLWNVYFTEVSALSESDVNLLSVYGVTEYYLTRRISGQTLNKSIDEFIIKRFYLSLIIYGLWNGRSIWDQSNRFNLSRGYLQSLLSSASSFASCVSHFCQELEEFWPYQSLLSGDFLRKLSFCVSSELLVVLEIPGVKMARARQLCKAGYNSLSKIASESPSILSSKIEHLPLKVAKQIISSSKMILSEKAETLREQAEEIEFMNT